MIETIDPEEPVTLSGHGVMTLRCAVARAMTLLPDERDAAMIIRQSDALQATLNFERIKELAVRLGD